MFCVSIDLTMSQAREKIKQLQDQVKRLHKEAKSKIIEQMRKHKQVNTFRPSLTSLSYAVYFVLF